MLQNKQSWKYLIGRSYKNEEFDWPFDLVIVTWKNNPNYRYAPGGGGYIDCCITWYCYQF